MSLVNAWGVALEDDPRWRLRLGDFIAFAVIPFGILSVPGTAWPLNESIAVLYVVALLRRPAQQDLRIPLWFGGTLLVLLAWYFIASGMAGSFTIRRLGHMAVGTALCLMLASGRVDLRSAARGLATGLLVALGVSIAMLPQSGYASRLTGVLSDPNGAGFTLVSIGFLAIGMTSNKRLRWVLAISVLVGTGLTISRTSWLALAIGLAWVTVGRWLGNTFATIAVAIGIWSIQNIPYDKYFASSFKDRTGSDQLRGRIIIKERESIAMDPWTGHGAGAQSVEVGGNDFFFHNSYLSVQNEVGIIGLAMYLFLVVVLWQRAVSLPLPRRNAWLEASILTMLVCAMNIGDVLLSLNAFVIIGILSRHVLVEGAALTAEAEIRDSAAAVGPAPRRSAGASAASAQTT